MIQIWYPTLASEGRPAPDDSPRIGQLVAGGYRVPPAEQKSTSGPRRSTHTVVVICFA
jgi:hypothetical protein